MKKYYLFITILALLTSCSTSKEAKTSRIEKRQNQKIITAELVKNAVENRKYIIRLDRLYPTRGGIVHLLPRSNYIVIDGNIASVRAAYLGRQYDIQPIAGIRLAAKTEDYSINKNFDKQEYKINLKLSRGGDTFDVSLNIKSNGKCSASFSSLKIDVIHYSGDIIPIPDNKSIESLDENVI